MAQAHIGGKILGPFKAKMAEKQQTIALEQIEKINAAINKWTHSSNEHNLLKLN